MTHTYTKSEWMKSSADRVYAFSHPSGYCWSLWHAGMTGKLSRHLAFVFPRPSSNSWSLWNTGLTKLFSRHLCLFSTIKQFLKSMKHRTDRTLQQTFMSFLIHQAIPGVYGTQQWQKYSVVIHVFSHPSSYCWSLWHNGWQKYSADIYVFSHPSSNSWSLYHNGWQKYSADKADINSTYCWSLWHTGMTEVFSSHYKFLSFFTHLIITEDYDTLGWQKYSDIYIFFLFLLLFFTFLSSIWLFSPWCLYLTQSQCLKVFIWQNQHTRELISARKTSHKHNDKDLSLPR